MKLTQKQGENLWQHLVEVLGVSTTYQKENIVFISLKIQRFQLAHPLRRIGLKRNFS